ncbi:MAG: hypothetical protein NTY64_08405 [Deltaproteobacteria bacterium]|nr:hypothetical protein [Deltaproteobacteria bacterium]
MDYLSAVLRKSRFVRKASQPEGRDPGKPVFPGGFIQWGKDFLGYRLKSEQNHLPWNQDGSDARRQAMTILLRRSLLDDLVKSHQSGWQSKKIQMQGAQILRNEAYLGCTPQ